MRICAVRAKRDAALIPEVQRVHRENFEVYGVRKVWRQMLREGFDVARCTVERLMRRLELKGVIRGKPVRTTIANPAAPCPLDHVNRQFRATRPNELWVSDFTYVSTFADSCNRSATSRRPRRKPTTVVNFRRYARRRNSHNGASKIPGAVHCEVLTRREQV